MKQEQIEQNNKNIEYIYNVLKTEIEKLGLNISITNENRYGELTEGNRILILNPNYTDFMIEVLGKEWNDFNKASLWCNYQRTRELEATPYYDGEPRTNTIRYEFENYFNKDISESLGLYNTDYGKRISSLNISFKATKNAKLILNDVLPVVNKYSKIIQIVSPKIDARIKEENEILALQQQLENLTPYKNKLYGIARRAFDIENIGTITVSEYGSIELKKDLEKSELLQLLGL